ncbi:MAG: VOC family protein [Hyphomicrobiaceae bacterium]
MSKMIFINLPVANLPKSIAFYESLGATKNPQFSDHTAACMVLSETIYVMLLTHEKFSQFTSKKIADARATCQVMLASNADNRDAVDARIAAASKAGGKADPGPKQDLGFMYSRSYEDLDGHIWEVFWMDMAAASKS